MKQIHAGNIGKNIQLKGGVFQIPFDQAEAMILKDAELLRREMVVLERRLARIEGALRRQGIQLL